MLLHLAVAHLRTLTRSCYWNQACATPRPKQHDKKTRLTVPTEMLLASLKAYVRHAAHLLSQVDKGAGLEFVTCMTASLGLLSDSLQTQVV